MKEKFECKNCHEKFEREIPPADAACCSDVFCPKCGSDDVDNATPQEDLLAYLKSLCDNPRGG
jgi:Zn finger protein HypA/HybF involved in hydrogenase expression